MPKIYLSGNKGIHQMSLSVNYNSLYKNGIDTSLLKDVSNEILRRAAQKNSQYTNSATVQRVNSTAKPVELGIDLYQGKLNTDVQKQISMNNTLQFHFNQATLNSIQYLNSQAAMSKTMDGKVIPAANEVVTETQKSVETPNSTQFMSIFAASTATDKNGSNPFNNHELLVKKTGKDSDDEKDNNSLKSIFS